VGGWVGRWLIVCVSTVGGAWRFRGEWRGVECRLGQGNGVRYCTLGMKRPERGGYVAGFGILDMTYVCAEVLGVLWMYRFFKRDISSKTSQNCKTFYGNEITNLPNTPPPRPTYPTPHTSKPPTPPTRPPPFPLPPSKSPSPHSPTAPPPPPPPQPEPPPPA